MTECFFSQPEDEVGRKNLKDIAYADVFPQINPYYRPTDDYFPAQVCRNVQQLRSQEHLRRMADLMNEHFGKTQIQDRHQLTDDQIRVQKIKQRMMKRKMLKQ